MSASDIVTTLFGLLGMYCAYRFGVGRGRALERNAKPEPVRAVCGCSHTLGAHKDGGRCLAQVRRPHYNTFGSRNGHEYVPCACTKYHGPVPVTAELFHPGFTTLGEIDK